MIFLKKEQIDHPIRIYDVSLETDNLGDEIIMKYAKKELNKLLQDREFRYVPTHVTPTANDLSSDTKCELSIVCGTNILCPNIEKYNLWRLPQDKKELKNIVFMAVGANNYGEFTKASKKFYKTIAHKKFLHSARDAYTYEVMKTIGIKNALNTGCLTMWGLTEEVCKGIPSKKATNAILTLTAHRPGEYVNHLIKTVFDNYENVIFWPQGDKDEEFISKFNIDKDRLITLPRTLASFEDILKNEDVDYVGTRLHGGIHALNYGKRAIIVEVDNRAVEIANSTGLPTVSKDCIDSLAVKLNDEIVFDLAMPWESISMWRNQWLEL